MFSIIDPIFCLQKDVAYPGNDIIGSGGEQPDNWRRDDPSDCITLCKSVKGCTHFGWASPEHKWTRGRKRCYLKEGNNVTVGVKKENVVSAVLANCEGTWDMWSGLSLRDLNNRSFIIIQKLSKYCISETCIRTDLAYNGTEISRNVTISSFICRKNCLQTSNCLAFSWNDIEIEKQCILFSEITTVKDTKNVVSGLKHCGNFFI